MYRALNAGLGRVEHFDPRNLDYLISDVVQTPSGTGRALVLATRGAPGASAAPQAARVATGKYFYDAAWWGDQGDTPHCTAFAAMHAMADGPVTHPEKKPLMEPHAFFEEIRQIDVSEGRDYGGDGATSLAMAKALARRGWIGEYRWGYTLKDLVAALQVGPVLLGIDWYTGMDNPHPKHPIVRAQGSIRGGHEIEANGIDLDDGFIRLKQSWQRKSYGDNGHALLPLEDAEILMATGADVCMFRELPTKR
jgi:hypothetical protein